MWTWYSWQMLIEDQIYNPLPELNLNLQLVLKKPFTDECSPVKRENCLVGRRGVNPEEADTLVNPEVLFEDDKPTLPLFSLCRLQSLRLNRLIILLLIEEHSIMNNLSICLLFMILLTTTSTTRCPQTHNIDVYDEVSSNFTFNSSHLRDSFLNWFRKNSSEWTK